MHKDRDDSELTFRTRALARAARYVLRGGVGLHLLRAWDPLGGIFFSHDIINSLEISVWRGGRLLHKVAALSATYVGNNILLLMLLRVK